MTEAVKLIKTSRLGETSGSAALYELPWYAVIGNPAAGKSSAVVKSGLKFPFCRQHRQRHPGYWGHTPLRTGTSPPRASCSTRRAATPCMKKTVASGLGFLSLLKKHRPKAPLNGVIIAVSVAELGGATSPEFAIDLARKLRQRVQELTEKLEVFAPVYVLFTKADLIAGFVDFFEDRERSERDKVWGRDPAVRHHRPWRCGRPVRAAVRRAVPGSERRLRGAHVACTAGSSCHLGVLTFPLEFAALKPALAHLPQHPVRGQPLSVPTHLPRLLLHQRRAGRAVHQPRQRARCRSVRAAAAARRCSGRLFAKRLLPQGAVLAGDLCRPRSGQAVHQSSTSCACVTRPSLVG
jgi:type VI secretion system protein ImpL